MYDLFYVSRIKTEEYLRLKEIYPTLKLVPSVQRAKLQCLTEMFWIIWDDIKIKDNFDFSYKVDSWSKEYIHIFLNETEYDGLVLFPKNTNVTDKELAYRFFIKTKEVPIIASEPIPYQVFHTNSYEDYQRALEESRYDMFWIVPEHVRKNDNFNFDIYSTHHQLYERAINHVFLNGKFHDGIVLCSKKSRFSKKEYEYGLIAHKKESPIVASSPKPFDIVFISYQEPNADENFKKIQNRFPNVKRVHGVKGIHQAHIEAAKLCETSMFWIVDGDAELVEDFDFSYQSPKWEHDIVHVWRSINPVNGLTYGYGGVKLFPRLLTLNMDLSKPDMTTSISSKFKAIEQVSNITAFNTDPFNTWKSAFRECAKLSSKVIDRQKDEETQARLVTWCSVGHDAPFGKYAIDGAKMGTIFGNENKDNKNELRKINDFDWLKEKFDARNI